MQKSLISRRYFSVDRGSSVDPNNGTQSEPNILQEMFAHMVDIVDLNVRALDHIAPYHSFNDNLTRYQEYFSEDAHNLVGQIYTKISNVKDAHFTTEQSITELCSLSANLIVTFNKLLDNTSPAKLGMQKKLLKSLLDSRLLRTNANDNAIFHNFNEASDKVCALHRTIGRDYNPKSDYYKMRIDLLRPVSHEEKDPSVDSEPIDSIDGKQQQKTEGSSLNSKKAGKSNADEEFEKNVLDLKKQLEAIQKDILSLKNKMNDAKENIGNIKKEITQTMTVINELKPKIEQLVTIHSEFIESIKESANTLLKRCDGIRNGHKSSALK